MSEVEMVSTCSKCGADGEGTLFFPLCGHPKPSCPRCRKKLGPGEGHLVTASGSQRGRSGPWTEIHYRVCDRCSDHEDPFYLAGVQDRLLQAATPWEERRPKWCCEASRFHTWGPVVDGVKVCTVCGHKYAPKLLGECHFCKLPVYDGEYGSRSYTPLSHRDCRVLTPRAAVRLMTEGR